MQGADGKLIDLPISYSTFYLVYACKRCSNDTTTTMCDTVMAAYNLKDLSSFYFLTRNLYNETARPVWLSIGY